jgi:GNAT superfamily N-acetyltransferase
MIDRSNSVHPTMPQTITDLSIDAVIDAIESNLIEASATLGRSASGVVYRAPDVTWVYTGYPLLSRVMRARFNGGEAEERVNQILSCFKKWDASVSWIIGPGSAPLKLAELLHKAGFGSSESRTAMAMNLTTESPSPDPSWPSGLRIQIVSDEVGLRAWATLSSETTFQGDSDGAVQIFCPANAGSEPRCRYYLGYLDGQPIARAMSFTDNDITGIYWLTTLRTHRGRGVGQAMAHRLLSDARTAGSRMAVISTPQTGLELCRRIGFKSYCQFHVYHWPPSPLRMPYA